MNKLIERVCEGCHGKGGWDFCCDEGRGWGMIEGYQPCAACDGSGKQFEYLATDGLVCPGCDEVFRGLSCPTCDLSSPWCE